ncbi:nucleotidyltransferase substrate binding protein [Crenothrix polyspora]|uniref:Nucleotidyltransferase n=1 Tax=Crenothrix polyspora TaxID=360316 RepID=A0A1R4HGU2_9GAMM|nr:nucleotidyltransferase substrate binding protein [Crenothrix polyspora]SJM95429.1 conserved hypothetical protein [Crenothrix polyspora]
MLNFYLGVRNVGDWTVWRDYRHARSNSSHTYNGNKAEAVYQIAADFLAEASYLYQRLIDKNQPT